MEMMILISELNLVYAWTPENSELELSDEMFCELLERRSKKFNEDEEENVERVRQFYRQMSSYEISVPRSDLDDSSKNDVDGEGGEDGTGDTLSDGAIAGIAIGATVIAGIIAVGAWRRWGK